MVLTKVMIVTCGAERYGLALDTVSRPTRSRRSHRADPRGQGLPAARRRSSPLVSAGPAGRRGAPEVRAAERVIVARVQGELVGFAVDAIVDRMDAAVRPMTGLLAGAPGVMGTTLLADGAVLMILDLAELIL
jgi:two-component system chemotaxis sensor kinase CheA